MKILLAGAGGQVGWEIARRAAVRNFILVPCARGELDISRQGDVARMMDRIRPDLVINAAAYTKVDQAESEPEAAFLANGTGPGILAAGCADAGIPMIHISTDYVFDGSKKIPYLESDPISPRGTYGRSKADGEVEVRRKLPRHLIVRTAWVYGVHGANFVQTMLRVGQQRQQLRVVDDQFGCPTAAADIAEALLTMAERVRAGESISWGTYHFCGEGIITWRRFAVEIFEVARRFGYPASPEIEAISTSEYPTPVKRPAFSALDTTRIKEAFGIHPRPWRESLVAVVEEMLETE